MCLTFKKNNKQTKKPVNCVLQDDASAGIRSLQTSIEIKLCQNPWNRLQEKQHSMGQRQDTNFRTETTGLIY